MGACYSFNKTLFGSPRRDIKGEYKTRTDLTFEKKMHKDRVIMVFNPYAIFIQVIIPKDTRLILHQIILKDGKYRLFGYFDQNCYMFEVTSLFEITQNYELDLPVVYPYHQYLVNL
jgi:hypothetical protein